MLLAIVLLSCVVFLRLMLSFLQEAGEDRMERAFNKTLAAQVPRSITLEQESQPLVQNGIWSDEAIDEFEESVARYPHLYPEATEYAREIIRVRNDTM